MLKPEKTRMTPFHPQSDDQVERFNLTLVELLRSKIAEDHTDWDTQLWSCLMEYRSSEDESTGETPNQHYAATKNWNTSWRYHRTSTWLTGSPTLKTAYAEALKQRLVSAHKGAPILLKKSAVRRGGSRIFLKRELTPPGDPRACPAWKMFDIWCS